MNHYGNESQTLEEVRGLFEEWRKARKRGERIPEPLWSAAVRLSRCHSLTEISQSLRVEFNHLKRRCSTEAVQGDGFVELQLPPPKESMCLIEVERVDGARMRIRGAVEPKLMDLVRAFCR